MSQNMTAEEKKIAEIREALEQAEREGPGLTHHGWLRFLLSELERIKEENRKLREERDAWRNAVGSMSVVQRLQKREKKLVEALQIIKERSTDYCAVGVANDTLKELI